jgi:hypothetical protein
VSEREREAASRVPGWTSVFRSMDSCIGCLQRFTDPFVSHEKHGLAERIELHLPGADHGMRWREGVGTGMQGGQRAWGLHDLEQAMAALRPRWHQLHLGGVRGQAETRRDEFGPSLVKGP